VFTANAYWHCHVWLDVLLLSRVFFSPLYFEFTMTPEQLTECAKLTGCAMMECLGHLDPCWQSPAWKPGDKPRGLGDVIATVTHYTGIAAAVKAINPNCGCAERQEFLNKQLPFGGNP